MPLVCAWDASSEDKCAAWEHGLQPAAPAAARPDRAIERIPPNALVPGDEHWHLSILLRSEPDTFQPDQRLWDGKSKRFPTSSCTCWSCLTTSSNLVLRLCSPTRRLAIHLFANTLQGIPLIGQPRVASSLYRRSIILGSTTVRDGGPQGVSTTLQSATGKKPNQNSGPTMRCNRTLRSRRRQSGIWVFLLRRNSN